MAKVFLSLTSQAYAENSRKNTGSIFGLMNEVAQVGKTIK